MKNTVISPDAAPPSPMTQRLNVHILDNDDEDPSAKKFKMAHLDAKLVDKNPPVDVDALNSIAADNTLSDDERQKAVDELNVLTTTRGKKQKILCDIHASDPSRMTISAAEASLGSHQLSHAGVSGERLSWIQQNCPYVLKLASCGGSQAAHLASLSPKDLLEVAEEHTEDVAVFMQPGEVQPQGAEVYVDNEISTALEKMIRSGKLHSKAERQAREGLRNLMALGETEERLVQFARTPYLLMAAQNDAAGVFAMTSAELEDWATFEEPNEDAGIDVDTEEEKEENEDEEVKVEDGQEEDVLLNLLNDEELEEAMKPDTEEVLNTLVEEGGLRLHYDEFKARARKHVFGQVEEEDGEDDEEESAASSRLWSLADEDLLKSILLEKVGEDWKAKLQVKYQRHGDLFTILSKAFSERSKKSIRAKVFRLVFS